jgi:hypothetical protein
VICGFTQINFCTKPHRGSTVVAWNGATEFTTTKIGRPRGSWLRVDPHHEPEILGRVHDSSHNGDFKQVRP